MEEDKAIELVAQELRQGDPLYAFKPDDFATNFFIGEAIIIAAATVLVGGIIKGVNEAIEERGKELGKTVTNWIVNKIESLFRKPKQVKSKKEEFEKELRELSKSASKLDKKKVDARLDTMEKQMGTWLERQGISPRQAKEIAKRSRAAAKAEISKASVHGTK